jgi:poly-beta-1,6-N-acetyl-D-glucosamine N-deacetylase
MNRFKSIHSTFIFMIALLMSCSSYAELDKPMPIKLQENAFITLTFHDVRDDVAKRGDHDPYAVSTQHLAQYLNWLQREGWQPIRLEDVWLARQGRKTLPQKAVLLTFDDGALSHYTRVFPLLKQYQIPAVFAVVSSWINGNTDDIFEAYGTGNVLNWTQIREMKASGLAEFVSHSDNLHHGVIANPQQNMQPAALSRIYFDKEKRYESDVEFEVRILSDLKKSKGILDRELNQDTRAIFWPYGAVSIETQQIATRAGLPMSFSLGSVAPLADSIQTYQRELVVDNPTPEKIHQDMLIFLKDSQRSTQKRRSFIGVNLDELSASNALELNENLGRFLSQIEALKTDTLVLKALKMDTNGLVEKAYFPNRQFAVEQDILNRVLWQARTRIHNRIYVEMPLNVELQQGYHLTELTADLVKNNSLLEGLIIDTDRNLICAVQQQQWTIECEQKIKTVFDIKENTKRAATYHTNISNHYHTVLKIPLESTQLAGLKKLLDYSIDYDDFIYVELDPLKQPNVFTAFKEQLKQLNAKEQQHLIVALKIPEVLNAQQNQQLKYAYQELKHHSIQQLAIANYGFKNAATVHQKLYGELSLNTNPLNYSDPFKEPVKAKEVN